MTQAVTYERETKAVAFQGKMCIRDRWVKKTAGNGRLTERELMCDGGLLWEIDENGIRTDYA